MKVAPMLAQVEQSPTTASAQGNKVSIAHHACIIFFTNYHPGERRSPIMGRQRQRRQGPKQNHRCRKDQSSKFSHETLKVTDQICFRRRAADDSAAGASLQTTTPAAAAAPAEVSEMESQKRFAKLFAA